MIPIFSILCALASVLTCLCFFRIRVSYKKTGLEWYNNISKSFLFFTLYFLSLAATAIFSRNLKLVELNLDLALFFLYVAIAYLFLIPFRVRFFKNIKDIFLFQTSIFLGLTILIFNLLNLETAIIHIHNSFIFWEESRAPAINIFSGIFIELCLIALFLFQIRYIFKEILERVLKFRAFLMSIALLCFVFGAGLRLIFYYWMDIFWAWSLAFLFGAIGTITMIISIVLVKPKKEKLVKTIR